MRHRVESKTTVRNQARTAQQRPAQSGSVDAAVLDLNGLWVAAVRERLLDWYRAAGRRLPWRVSCDSYRILVSEMMLVQTTVAAVIPFFERFIARFPDVAALAAADEAEVVKAWEGLGYYRRARQLHQAARTIVRDHGGMIPDDPDGGPGLAWSRPLHRRCDPVLCH